MAKKQKTSSNKEAPAKKPNPSEVVAQGVVEEALANAMFRVKLNNDVIILCTICGKIRKNNIRILPGDRVDVGVNIYDMSKGRILFRYKN